MIILPPDVVINKQRYFSDLKYRREYDLEIEAERHERIQILFSNDQDQRFTCQCNKSQ